MRTSTRCNRDVPRGRTRWARSIKLFLMLFLLGSFLAPAKLNAQVIRIDGNPTSVAGEWSTANSSIRRIGDKYNIVNQDTIFAGNEKDFMFAVPDWHWKLGTAKDKNDIANGAAGLVSAVDTVDGNGGIHHLTGNFLVFAGDRISNDGDAQIGFWFFQDGTGPVAGGNFAPEKHYTPAPGDLLVLADFTGGGRNANVTVLQFVGTGGTYPNSNGAFNQVNVGAAVAENNAGSNIPIPTGWVFTDKKTGNPTYSTNEFYEGYVDLSIFGAGRHFCPSTFQLETRASQSITATLDDFVNGALAGAPDVPTVQGASRCGSGSITISAACTGTTVRWYTAASGGTPIVNGAPYTISGSDLTIDPLSATTTFYASCYNATTGCESARVPVVATVNPNPAPTAHNLSSCETGSTGAASFDLNTAINSADGGTISFYTSLANAQAGTSPIATPGAYSVSVGTVTIYVRSVNGSCYGTTSFTVTVNANPTANAGPDQAKCQTGASGPTSFTLAGTAANGTTAWTQVASTGTAVATIATPSSLTSTVSVAGIGTVTLRLTTTSASCGTATDDVILTVNANPTANAGPDQAKCQTGASGPTAFTLAATAANGTTSWSQVASTGTANSDITSGTALNGTVNVSGIGTVTLRLTTTSVSCGTATDDVILTVNANPTANAGPDQAKCQTGASGPTSFTLAGTAANGTTAWTQVASTGTAVATIATPSSLTSTVSVAGIGTVTLRLTTTSASCGTATDDVILTVNANPTANAGPDQSKCQTKPSGPTAFTLAATAANGTTSWTQVASTGTANSDITSGTALNGTVNVSGIGTVTLRLTTTSASCGTATDDVILTVTQNPTANAGNDATQCRNSVPGTNTFGTNTFNLSGSGSAGSCSWSVVSNTAGYTITWGGTGQNSCAPSVSLSGAAVNGGSVTLRLTVTGDCGSATDDVVLTLTALPLIYTVTGTDFCPNAPNTGTITLSGSEVGVNYQLSKDGIIQVGQDKAGTGSSLTWTNLGTGNYSVIGTRIGTSCSTTSGPDNVAENNAPDPSVTNLTSCEDGSTGGASFNLNNAVTAADGGTITFYTSLADAQAGSNAVSSTQTVTVAASPKTFWVRSQNATTGCYGIRSFTVTVTDNPDVTAHNLTSCETGTTGAASFNLNNAINDADGGTVSFYTSLANAQAGTSAIATPTAYSVNIGTVTIYVRSANGSCYGTTSFTVTVTDNPDVTVQNLTSCETGTTGHATFNLNSGVTNADGGTVTFYASQADANAATNAIASPTTYSAPIGVTTIWVRDANGTCATVTSFTITVHANPTPTADNKEVCVGATVDLTGSPMGGTWSGDHVTGSTFNAAGVAAGNYTVTYTVTDEFGCTGSATATVTVKACGGPLCTYTQGYYGNTNGNSCDADGTGSGPVTYQNPVALITAQLLNGGTMTVGKGDRSVYLPVPDAVTTATRVNSVMPGSSTPRELTVSMTGGVDINSATFTNNYLTKQGKINNVLLSQTITLGLNMRISSGLPDFALQAGEFATATPDGPCGTKTTKPQCTYSTVYPYGLVGGDTYTYKTITADVITALTNKGYPLTVSGLFMLANDALGNADGTTGTEGGASLSAINAAVSAINEGFDKCRVFVGWNVAHCQSTDPAMSSLIVAFGASRTANTGLTQVDQTDKLSVAAYPNPFNDVVKFSIQSKVSGNAQLTIYNMLGQKINTIYNGYVPANKNISVEYKAQKNAQQNLIYILTINGEKVTGKVLNINN